MLAEENLFLTVYSCCNYYFDCGIVAHFFVAGICLAESAVIFAGVLSPCFLLLMRIRFVIILLEILITGVINVSCGLVVWNI